MFWRVSTRVFVRCFYLFDYNLSQRALMGSLFQSFKLQFFKSLCVCLGFQFRDNFLLLGAESILLCWYSLLREGTRIGLQFPCGVLRAAHIGSMMSLYLLWKWPVIYSYVLLAQMFTNQWLSRVIGVVIHLQVLQFLGAKYTLPASDYFWN